MSKTIEFYFDFGSPAAYLAWTQLPAIAGQASAELVYKPALLGGIFQAVKNATPAAIPAKGAYMFLDLQRHARRYGVPFRLNPFFPVNTLNLMRAAIAAKLEGVFERYVEAAFHHMWREPKKMDDPEVAAKALSSSGLDGARLLTRAQEPEVKAKLL